MKTSNSRKEKVLGFWGVLFISLGSTLGSGLLILPGAAYAASGPSAVLAFLFAALLLVPPMLCVLELATAMPRNAGTYFFLDRCLGPYFGTIGGIGVWFVVVLKVSFALIGIGLFTGQFFPELSPIWISIPLAIAFAGMNLLGVKKIGFLQSLLLIVFLAILVFFLSRDFPAISQVPVRPMFSFEWESLFATTGLVFISYLGIVKVASVSEEIRKPEINIPLGIFVSLALTFLVAFSVLFWLQGVLEDSELSGNLTAILDAGEKSFGTAGKYLALVAVLSAFFAAANAGVLNASRFPEAMSKDHHLPKIFASKLRNGMPDKAIYLTLAAIILCLLGLNPLSIAKLASGFQLLIFMGLCVSVVLMRESRIKAYDPGFKVPFYPWIPFAGILLSFYAMINLGWGAILFTTGLVVFGSVWYRNYTNKHVIRQGAIYHIFERLGRRRYEGLDRELREILKEKGLRTDDPFENMVAEARFIESEWDNFEELTRRAAAIFQEWIGLDASMAAEEILEGTRTGATPVSAGAALPHLRSDRVDKPFLLIARAKNGIEMRHATSFIANREKDTAVYAFFFLISPEKEVNLHLRLLAQIAEIVDQDDFTGMWRGCANMDEIKEIFFRKQRYFTLEISPQNAGVNLVGKKVMDAGFPPKCLVAIIRRHGQVIIPSGDIQLRQGDKLTIIGEPKGIAELKRTYQSLDPKAFATRENN